jgi:hypothetical protein
LELKLNGTHRLLAYADDVNLLGYNIDTTKENTETSIDATKEVSLEVNRKKTQYIVLTSCQNARKNHNIKIKNSSRDNVAEFE